MIILNIVPTNVLYNYELLKENINSLHKKYNFLDISSIGNSILGKNIYAIKLGSGIKKVFYCGSFHANEWITSVLLMYFIEDYCNCYISNSLLFGYSIQELFNSSSIYIVPMVNPDGVDLVTKSLNIEYPSYKDALKISKKFNNIPFPLGWKSNITGTDLNLQFPAGWENAKKIKYKQGFTRSCSTRLCRIKTT